MGKPRQITLTVTEEDGRLAIIAHARKALVGNWQPVKASGMEDLDDIEITFEMIPAPRKPKRAMTDAREASE